MFCHLSTARCPLLIPLPFTSIFGNLVGQHGELLASPILLASMMSVSTLIRKDEVEDIGETLSKMIGLNLEFLFAAYNGLKSELNVQLMLFASLRLVWMLNLQYKLLSK
ncbi:hypothetical protein V6N13_040128 [Hibiscus sabdariffa]|uniref:Uncharacterized protein n=1 Tax=Hibiscus sabdariffa TaxID=183260 RepID=A0ABR2STD9_9ROSI